MMKGKFPFCLFLSCLKMCEGLQLIGGAGVNGGNETEELVPIDEGPNEPIFFLKWSEYTDGQICSIKIDDTSFVLTGGGRSHSEMKVTQLSKLQSWKNVTFKDLPQLNTGREHHACGSYLLNGDLILIVAGGTNDREQFGGPLSSTEIMNFMDQSGGWRQTTALPSARFALTGASLSGVFHVIGGSRKVNQYCDNNTEILSWDSVGENWNLVGQTLLPRDEHAVTVVNLDDLKPLCIRPTTVSPTTTNPTFPTTTNTNYTSKTISPTTTNPTFPTTTSINSTATATFTAVVHVLFIALLIVMK